MKHRQNKTGFTMIELLIVIVIMGILSAVGIGTFTSSQLKARDSKRKSDLRTMGDAFEAYYNDFGSYPVDDGTGGFRGCGVDANTDVCAPGDEFSNATNGTTYMVQVPSDPSDGTYYYMSDGTFYRIYAHLENDRDREAAENGGNPSFYAEPEMEAGNNACGLGDCNFVRTSTNVNKGTIN